MGRPRKVRKNPDPPVTTNDLVEQKLLWSPADAAARA